MTPFEEVKSGAYPVPRPASPLPWLLLCVSLTLTVSVLTLSKRRLDGEAQRTATALKANDEVQAKLRAALAEVEKLKEASGQTEASTGDLSAKIVTLKLQLRAQEEELTTLRARVKK
jgi:hypothetical protein